MSRSGDRGPDPGTVLRRLALATVALLLAGLAAARGVQLARGEVLATAGERRWYGYAQRQPARVAALVDAASRVPGGARVELVVPPDTDLRWLEIVAFYHLPGAWIVAVRTSDERPSREVRSGRAGVTHRVHLLPDGTAGVRPLAPSRGGPPPEAEADGGG